MVHSCKVLSGISSINRNARQRVGLGRNSGNTKDPPPQSIADKEIKGNLYKDMLLLEMIP